MNEAWGLLLGSDIGLLSLFTIGFIILMGFFLYAYAKRHMREDEARAIARAAKKKQQREAA